MTQEMLKYNFAVNLSAATRGFTTLAILNTFSFFFVVLIFVLNRSLGVRLSDLIVYCLHWNCPVGFKNSCIVLKGL